jgi:hypothetical protein
MATEVTSMSAAVAAIGRSACGSSNESIGTSAR